MNPLTLPTTTQVSVAGAFIASVFLVAFILVPVSKPVPHRTLLFPHSFVLDSSALVAKAAIVYDPATNTVLYAKNAQSSLPLASLTKLMTAQAVLAVKPSNTRVTITPSDLKPDGDWGFRPGDTVSLSDLIAFGLVASSNDAMAAAAASIGQDYVASMNKTAQSLGLSRTLFLNSTGLDVTTDTSGAYGSAMDVARLAATFMRSYPEYFELTTESKISIPDGARMLLATSTALPLADTPGFIGAKTGFTDLAGGNLVAAFDADIGHPLIAVVLGSTEEGRFSDIKELIHQIRIQ